MSNDKKKLMETIGYSFKNPQLLEKALTHSSYANEVKTNLDSNERLEFLGDSVLSLVVAEYLYHDFPEVLEGDLTRMRANLVCEKALGEFAEEIQLEDYIKLGKGELASGGRQRLSIRADAFEALIAAIYLDGGMEKAKPFILRFVKKNLHESHKSPFVDYKTALQEIVQQNKEEILRYVLVEESGPDHDKHFVVEVHLNSNVIGKGEARSKKEAEQRAAKEALALMGR